MGRVTRVAHKVDALKRNDTMANGNWLSSVNLKHMVAHVLYHSALPTITFLHPLPYGWKMLRTLLLMKVLSATS